MQRILIATSNQGKLRDFAGAAAPHGIEIALLANYASLPEVKEDGDTFEANARKKAEHYSRHAAGEIVLADDSGLEVKKVPPENRAGHFVCVIAAARDGEILAVFRGQAEGMILDRPRGSNGFGYDPLFYSPRIKKTFAELTLEEKARYSHRGEAFR